jgi:ankyrin repeat protein
VGERRPYYYIGQLTDAIPRYGFRFHGIVHTSLEEPGKKLSGILPPTAVFDPKKPERVIVLENYLPRGVMGRDVFVTQERAMKFFSAVERGDVPAINTIMKAKHYLEIEDSRGRTPLIAAAQTGEAASIKALLSRGAEVDRASFQGVTPLMAACAGGQEEAVDQLLDSGANPNTVRDTGETPLIIATRRGYGKIAERLIEAGADIETCDSQGRSALIWALHNGRSEIAKRLIERGASVNGKTKTGFTPLILAVKNREPELVRSILEKGASPNERITVLVEGGEFADLREILGMEQKKSPIELSPLALTLLYENTEVARHLLDAGADMHETLYNGNKILKEATLKGKTEIMKLLMDRGAGT